MTSIPHWSSPIASPCCISAKSSSRARAPRLSPTRAPRRSTSVRSALRLQDIDAYYGDSHVLQKLSFQLGEGRLLGLLGRNGAGKSTCMNVTVGLLPPRAGAVEVFGSAVTKLPPELIAVRGVALVPQGRRIFKSLTVRENLIVAARKPIPGSHAAWTPDTVVGMFPRLAERRSQMAAHLSGVGEALVAGACRGLVMTRTSGWGIG